MLTPRRLSEWMSLHDRRRHGARLLTRLTMVPALLIGAALAVEIARRDDLEAASVLWSSLLVAVTALALVTAPFRLFWSPDADSLARYPIAGRALFWLGARRNLQVALGLGLAPAIATAGFAVAGEPGMAVRHLLLSLSSTAATALGGPAISLLAGALAASERADAIARSFGGEFQAPRGAYLGIVPGVIGAAVLLGLIVDRSWAIGGDGIPALALAIMAGSAVAPLWALTRADQVMPGAVRELSALNRRRLAHIDVTRLSILERIALAMLGRRAQPIVAKDLRLLRRRHPSYYLVQALLIIGAWITALTRADAGEWIPGMIAGAHAYSVVMTLRALRPPIEDLADLDVLPFLRRDVRVAKLAPHLVRTALLSVALGGALWTATSVGWAMVVTLGFAAFATIAASIAVFGSVRD